MLILGAIASAAECGHGPARGALSVSSLVKAKGWNRSKSEKKRNMKRNKRRDSNRRDRTGLLASGVMVGGVHSRDGGGGRGLRKRPLLLPTCFGSYHVPVANTFPYDHHDMCRKIRGSVKTTNSALDCKKNRESIEQKRTKTTRCTLKNVEVCDRKEAAAADDAAIAQPAEPPRTEHVDTSPTVIPDPVAANPTPPHSCYACNTTQGLNKENPYDAQDFKALDLMSYFQITPSSVPATPAGVNEWVHFYNANDDGEEPYFPYDPAEVSDTADEDEDDEVSMDLDREIDAALDEIGRESWSMSGSTPSTPSSPATPSTPSTSWSDERFSFTTTPDRTLDIPSRSLPNTSPRVNTFTTPLCVN
ncbi:hypothetical protein HK102_008509 [Quaeritorhiza haematococci]|nr:hypothetical protein HK102_008509 [Quaeritorhiza haematococci]